MLNFDFANQSVVLCVFNVMFCDVQPIAVPVTVRYLVVTEEVERQQCQAKHKSGPRVVTVYVSEDVEGVARREATRAVLVDTLVVIGDPGGGFPELIHHGLVSADLVHSYILWEQQSKGQVHNAASDKTTYKHASFIKSDIFRFIAIESVEHR